MFCAGWSPPGFFQQVQEANAGRVRGVCNLPTHPSQSTAAHKLKQNNIPIPLSNTCQRWKSPLGKLMLERCSSQCLGARVEAAALIPGAPVRGPMPPCLGPGTNATADAPVGGSVQPHPGQALTPQLTPPWVVQSPCACTDAALHGWMQSFLG